MGAGKPGIYRCLEAGHIPVLFPFVYNGDKAAVSFLRVAWVWLDRHVQKDNKTGLGAGFIVSECFGVS